MEPQQKLQLLLTPELLEEAKGWILDCKESFRDIEAREDLDEMTQAEIEEGLEVHYSGGLKQFILNSGGNLEYLLPRSL